MILCEKCKTDGASKIHKTRKGELVCDHIYQQRYYAKNKEKASAYQKEYRRRKGLTGSGRGKSKRDWNKLFDEMVNKVARVSFEPNEIQKWSPDKIIRNWGQINF